MTSSIAIGAIQPQAIEPASVDSGSTELVFGFVGPTGVDLGRACDELTTQLALVDYKAVTIRISDLLAMYLGKPEVTASSEYERLTILMDYGNELREQTKQGDIAARLAIARIRASRAGITSDAQIPASRTAYIIRSLKRDDEIELLRNVYGSAFTLVSVYSTRDHRRAHLRTRLAATLNAAGSSAEELATRLIDRDYAEEGRVLGQKVGKAFPLADFFLRDGSRPEIADQLRRLVRLTLDDPYISPTRDEQAMFFAQAAAFRSLDLSRQVGAAVVDDDGELLTTGCNEVPKAGGGLYWAGDPKADRDFERGSDSNVDIKVDIVRDALRRLADSGLIDTSRSAKSIDGLADEALFGDAAVLKRSQLFDVIEFGRAVHAEMAAISQAARQGIRLTGARLFCTTFPCHLCARHIVASGIKDVYFIEPYEKSRAGQLYSDSISLEPPEPSSTRVNFRAFVGVAPRRYMSLFRLQRDRKTSDGHVLPAGELSLSPKVRVYPFAYLFAEASEIADTRATGAMAQEASS